MHLTDAAATNGQLGKARRWLSNNGHHYAPGELEAELRDLYDLSKDEIAELLEETC